MLEQLKIIELEIFDEFKRICDEHQIQYFLMGGTLLGCIRHKGYIPWDDDIDIGMSRDNYVRFSRIAQEELGERYFFQDFHTEPECGYVFGKIRDNQTVMSEEYSAHINMHQGVWIDIFPYDHLKNKNIVKRVQLLRALYIIKCGYKYPSYKKTFGKLFYYIAKLILKIVPLHFFISVLDQMMISGNDRRQDDVFCFGGAYGVKDIMPSELIENLIEGEFEGRKVLIFKDYDYYLRRLYGNYMELPPEDKRHGGMHYLKEIKLKK